MHKEEGFIYSLDTINNGALLQKNGEKPYLKCIVTDLSTLIESYNRKKTTHTFSQNNESFHTPKKRVPLKKNGLAPNFPSSMKHTQEHGKWEKRVKQNTKNEHWF
jgi:hypothetical protein